MRWRPTSPNTCRTLLNAISHPEAGEGHRQPEHDADRHNEQPDQHPAARWSRQSPQVHERCVAVICVTIRTKNRHQRRNPPPTGSGRPRPRPAAPRPGRLVGGGGSARQRDGRRAIAAGVANGCYLRPPATTARSGGHGGSAWIALSGSSPALFDDFDDRPSGGPGRRAKELRESSREDARRSSNRGGWQRPFGRRAAGRAIGRLAGIRRPESGTAGSWAFAMRTIVRSHLRPARPFGPLPDSHHENARGLRHRDAVSGTGVPRVAAVRLVSC